MLNFFKKFIYYTMSVFGLISLSLIPIKLYSQQQTNNPRWNLRNYITLLSPQDNQELHVTVFNWPDFIISTGDIFNMNRKDLPLHKNLTFHKKLLDGYELKLKPLEEDRLLTIKALLQSPKNLDAQIMTAILTGDQDFLRTLSLRQQHMLVRFSTIIKPKNISPSLVVVDFLTEAILANNLTAVRMILESDIRKQNNAEKYRLYNDLDPLSLSLVNYASLSNVHTSKKIALQIVRLMAKHTPDVNDISAFSWQISPVTWALTLGLKDEVEYLVKHKQAHINPSLQLNNRYLGLEMDLLDYLKLRKFNAMEQYIKKLKPSNLDFCKTVFH